MPLVRRPQATIEAEFASVHAQLAISRKHESDMQALLDTVTRMASTAIIQTSELEAKEKALAKELRPYLDTLPTELVIHIMLFTVETGIPDHFGVQSIILSQVCHRFRSIAHSTSEMWSSMCFSDSRWTFHWLPVFLDRSKSNSLDIVRFPPAVSAYDNNEEMMDVSGIFDLFGAHISRLRSLLFCFQHADAVDRVLNILCLELPRLTSLDLGLNVEPSSLSGSFLMQQAARQEDASWTNSKISRKWCALKHLRLQTLPLFSIPTYLLQSVTCLELSFPQADKLNLLTASTLLHFLSFTPQLEELLLTDASPTLDIFVQDHIPYTVRGQLHPVTLPHLRRLDWSYPPPSTVHNFLSFVVSPSLKKLDLCVEEPQTSTFTRDPTTLAQNPPDKPLTFDALEELSLQCSYYTSLDHVVRKAIFPVLMKLELSNCAPSDISRPNLPGFQCIFRDPFLPNLTHLTLSHFQLSTNARNGGTAILGYMPALTSLSIHSCTGVHVLLECLQQKTPLASGKRIIRKAGVKFCPRLEALALWDCPEVDFMTLYALVQSRNHRPDEPADGDVTPPKDFGKYAPVRIMRALPKGRIASVSAAGTIPLEPSSQQTPQGVDIVYVRFEDCGQINERQVALLKQLRVADVVWNSSDSTLA